mmetsp:Transcript_25057/g.72084  ORF Transcript_25057/g.72084 Transcript_25057/m.72084 type:complete len:371 (+) Transcript_25057:433-1545(+)
MIPKTRGDLSGSRLFTDIDFFAKEFISSSMIPDLGDLAHSDFHLGEFWLIRSILGRLGCRTLTSLFFLFTSLGFLVGFLLAGRSGRLVLVLLRNGLLIKNSANLDGSSHWEISAVHTQILQGHGCLTEFFENLGTTFWDKGKHQVAQSINRFQGSSNHHLTEFSMFVTLFQPRCFFLEIAVHISESLNSNVGTRLQFEGIHFFFVRLYDFLQVDRGIRWSRNIGNSSITILLAEVGSTVDGISKSITKIRIVHISHRVLTKGQLSTIGRFLAKIPAEGVDVELVEHVMRVHHISHTLGHFLSFLIVDKSMGKDGFRKRYTSRHEKTRPNHRVEPQDILSNNVHISRPKLGQAFSTAILIDTQSIHSSQIV